MNLHLQEVSLPIKLLYDSICCTSLKVLQDAYGLKRVAYTTYQAVSGSGMKGKKDLAEGVNGKAPEAYPHPIYNNVLPHIDVFLENGYTKRRTKMIDETRKF